METHELVVEIPHALMPVLPTLLARVRALFDVDLRPEVVARHLAHDPVLRASVNANPGLRLPGAFDGLETTVRAVLGQQVSVRAASTLAARFVETFGERIETPRADLNRLVPLPDRIAAIPAEDLARIGIPLARARSIVALAAAMASNTTSLRLGGCRDVSQAIEGLCAIPGIGTWTAHYIAMRVLRWPDAFPREDVALRRALGGATPAEAERRSQQWRPWRAYAVMHLWRLPAPARSGRRGHHR
jgi:AraC family transcriptional regulator of adaptative response / DNA-3-methyladenine glycosylase II